MVVEAKVLARPLMCVPNLINIWAEENKKAPKYVSCNKCFGNHGKQCIFNLRK
jgi:hypothetical protein